MKKKKIKMNERQFFRPTYHFKLILVDLKPIKNFKLFPQNLRSKYMYLHSGGQLVQGLAVNWYQLSS